MPLDIVVCVKQVIDPETPPSSFVIDRAARRAEPAVGVPPVLNGFDENALEAALRLKDAWGGTVTAISVGFQLNMEVMKKTLSMGADTLVLVQDKLFYELDGSGTAHVLAQGIKKIGRYNVILCGRQASDWDNAHTPVALAEYLGLPCITLARKIDVSGDVLTAERVTSDGYEVVECNLPAVVSISNEIYKPRYPTLKSILAARNKAAINWSAQDIGIDLSALSRRVQITDLLIPATEGKCEYIQGMDEPDSGRKLALRLRKARLL